MAVRIRPRRRSGTARRLSHRLAAVLAIAFFSAGLTSIEGFFAPKADLWARWQAHDPASRLTVDHRFWGAFLAGYVTAGADGIHRVAYRRIAAVDRDNLSRYVDYLAAQPVRGLNRAEQRAYWINLYNAATVRLILQYPDAKSIRDIDISPGLFADGPWDRKLVTIEGVPVSLNDIEHRILRPIWRDPRIHYAVNCASLVCPNLLREAFTANNAERLLDAGARAYINHPRGAALVDGKLTVSSIYVWFQEDFANSEAGVIAHLRRYAAPPLAAALAGRRRLDAYRYDWRLNGARGEN